MANTVLGFVTGKVPKVWGVNEAAKVYLTLDHRDLDTGLTLFFYSPEQDSAATNGGITVNRENLTFVHVSWANSTVDVSSLTAPEFISVTINDIGEKFIVMSF